MDTDSAKNHTVGRLKRAYVVDSAFQLKYAGFFAAAGVLVSGVCGLVAYWAHRSVQGEFSSAGEILRGDSMVLVVVIAMSAVMALGLSIVGILLTHRVAGPIYVMTKQLSDLAHGRYPSLRALRRGDELREFFELFQQAILLIRSREQEEVVKLDSAIDALSHMAISGELKATVQALAAIRNRKQDALLAPKIPSWERQPLVRA